MTTITEFRQKYPDYDKVDDETLARKLHEKYYQHVDYEEFASRFMPDGASSPPPTDAPVGGRTTDFGERVLAAKPTQMRPSIEELSEGPERDAYIAEHGTHEEQAEALRQQVGIDTEEQAAQREMRDAQALEYIEEGDLLTSTAPGGGFLGLPSRKDREQRVAEQGSQIVSLTDERRGPYRPEDYGLTREEVDRIQEDRVQQFYGRQQARAEAAEAAGAVPAPQDPDEVKSRWAVVGNLLKSIPKRTMARMDVTSAEEAYQEARDRGVGNLYLERLAEEDDRAKDLLAAQASDAGMSPDEYSQYVAGSIQEAAEEVIDRIETSGQLEEEARAGLPQIENFSDNPLGYLGNLAVQGTDSAAIMGLAFATRNPMVASTLFGEMAFNTRYIQSRSEGRSVGESTLDGMFSAAIEGATEGIPVGRILGRGKQSISRSKKLLEGIRDEALQEMLVEAANIAYDVGVIDKDMSIGEAAIAMRDAGLLGAMMGGGFAAPTAITGDFEMAKLETDISEAQKGLQSVANRMQNPNMRVTQEEITAARDQLTAAVKAKNDLLEQRLEAEKEKKAAKDEKKAAKQQAKREKKRAKMTPAQRRRDEAAQQAAETEVAFDQPLTPEQQGDINTMQKIIDGKITSSDVDAVERLLDAGYAKIMPSGAVALLPGGRRFLKAAQAAPEAAVQPDEVIEPTPYERPERRAERDAVDEEIGRLMRGEEVIEPQPFKSAERRRQEISARVDQKLDANVANRIADDIIKAEETEVAYEQREAELAAEADAARNEAYNARLNEQNAVEAETALNLARMDQRSQTGYKGTRLGDVLRGAMQTLEQEEAKAKEALLDAFWNKPTQGTLFDIGGALAKGTKDYANLVKVGALKIAKVGLNYSAWSADMVGEFGESIKPVLAKVWHDSKKRVRDIMRISHEKFESGPRKGELKYAPKKYAKPGRLQQLRRTLEKLAAEGERGRFWYEKSGKEILKATGGNKSEARKLAGLLAIYSSGTGVGPNLTNALKMWAQFKAGNLEMPKTGTKAGRFGEQDRTAIEWLQSKESDEYFVEKFGDKRYPFFQNLMREVDPDKYEVGQGATIDLWMMRAFGYDQPSPTTAQFAFATTEIKNLAEKLGWENQQAQAAVWVAIKARWEFIQKKAKEASVTKGYAKITRGAKGVDVFEVVGDTREEQIENEKKIIDTFREIAMRTSFNDINDKLDQSKADFADYMDRQYATISWEAEPSSKLGLPFDKMPIEAKMQMQAEIAEIMTNPETGREWLAEWLGLLGQDQFIGPGSWNMQVGATVQNSVLAPVEHKGSGKKVKQIQAEAKSAMDGYAAIVGYLLKQDAVAWHRPFYSASMKASNGLEIIANNFDHQRTIDLYSQIVAVAEANGIPYDVAVNWAPVVMEGSVRVFNYEDTTGIANRAFHKIIEEAANAAGVNGSIELFQSDGNLVGNDWINDKKGEAYVDQIRNSENPNVEEAFERAKSRLARKISAVYERYADKYGRVDYGQRAVSAPLSLGPIIEGGQAAAIEVGTRFGTVQPGVDTNAEMRVYDLDPLVENPEVQQQMADDYGYQIEYFSFEENPEAGVEFRIPQLKKKGYKDGYVWIYDPRNSAGSFKGAVEYTRAWRISHEIGHAVAEQFMDEKYGPSRRYGRMGRSHTVLRGTPGKQVEVEVKPLTLKEAQRAVEWEDVAFRAQREILKQYGIEITDAQFNQEFNINVSDALFRVLTGEFNDPGDRGFRPSDRPTNLKQTLKYLEEAEAQMAASQGRKPTEGVDLDKWRRTPISSLRAALNARRREVGQDTGDVMAALREAPTVTVKENELDEFEVREKNGEIYYTDDADDAINTARRIWGSDVTVEIVDEFGELIVSDEAPKPDKPKMMTLGIPEETLDKQKAVNEFMEEFIEETDANPLTAERIFGNVAAVELRPSQGEIWIDGVRSFEKGKGHGAEALKMLLNLADKHGVVLNLFAKPFGKGGLDNSALVSWYQRNGFYREGGAYVRQPQNMDPGRTMAAFKRPKNKTAEGFGLPVSTVQQFLDRFGELTGITNLKAVQAVEDLPEEPYGFIAMKGLADSVKGIYHNDPTAGPTIYVIGNNMYSEKIEDFGAPSVDMMVETVLHEAVGHYGVRALLGKDYDRYMDQIAKAFPAEVARRRKSYGWDNTVRGRRMAAEEVVAYMAQDELNGIDLTKVKASLLDRIIARIRLFLAEMGITEFNRNDLLNLIWRAADFTRRNSPATLNKRAMIAQDLLRAQKEAEQSEAMLSLGDDRKNDPDLDRFLDKIGHGKTTKMDNLKDWWEDHKGQWKRLAEIEIFDQYAGIRQAEKELNIFGDESGYISVRLAAGVDVMLRSALENGVPIWNDDGTVGFDPETKGLVEILAPVGQSGEMLKMFEAFIVARRAKGLRKEGRERLISREEIAAVYRYIKKNGLYGLFDRTQKEMAEYKGKVLDFAEEAGMIDGETRPLWDKQDHVPFYRVLGKDKTGPFAGSRIGQAGSAIKRLKGGTEYLKNPLESIVQNIGFLIESSVKNRAMADVIGNFDGTGLVSKAPQAEMSQALIPLEQIQNMLDEAGVSIDATGRGMLKGIQKLTSLQAPTADNIVSIQENGKRQYYYIHDTGIMRGLEVQPRNWEFLMKALRAPKRILTRAITLTPDFILKNWFRDMWHSWVLARIPGYVGVVPGIDSIKGWKAAVANDPVYKEMLAGGGMFDSGYVNASDPNKTNIAMRKALMGAGRGNVLDSPRKLARFYMRLANGAENAHRVAIYQKTLERTGSKKQALFESRDIMDFAVRGANPFVRFLTETVPFWGARVQGLARSGKGLKEAPMLTLMRGAPIILATLGLYIMNREDERYQGLAEYEKRMYYHFFDVFEDGDHWRLPKPFEVGALFSSLPEMMWEAGASEEPDKYKALGHSMYFILREMLMLSPDVQALNPLYELAINENRFTESPILTEWEKKKDPKQQYSYRTNATVRELAQSMPDWAPDWARSPKQLEHLVRGYFGSMMDYALTASDMVYYKTHEDEAQPPTMRWDETPFVRAFRRDTPAKYDIYLDTMYSTLEEADKIYNAINDLKKQRDREGAQAYRDKYESLLYARGPMNRARKKVRDINQKIKNIYQSTNYTPDEKREKIDELLKRRSEAARAVYDYRPGGKLNPDDGSEEEGFLESLIGKSKKAQVDNLVAAQLPHTAILVNDVNIDMEKLRDVA